LPYNQQYAQTFIQSLTATNDGELWVGYQLGDKPAAGALHVSCCCVRHDGVWNNTGAIISIYLPPTFWQGWCFKGSSRHHASCRIVVALSVPHQARDSKISSTTL
jgi:hypothetical protein